MKRSQINRIIEEAREHLTNYRCNLPAWAFWSPSDWENCTEDATEIKRHGLGWIVTDFGSDEFDKYGLVLFVARNGCLHQNKPLTTKTYAEKFMLVKPGQTTPYHFHWVKTEDLLNRSGGRLNVQLGWSANDERSMTNEKVNVQLDGLTKTLKPGEILSLEPGQSLELTPRMCHQFSGHPNDNVVLAGEISSLNDDSTDNCFLGRDVSPKPIEEDEPKRFLLASDS
ncbi:MAG TPA: D-lyxose/D-mannose family sugar isomerase [Oculatellaceae cyanobacterium]